MRRRGKRVRFDELLSHLQAVVPIVEDRDVEFSQAIRDPSLDGHESVEWLRRKGITVLKLGASPRNHGCVWPESDTIGAWGEPDLHLALEWLEMEFAKDDYGNKFDKLERSGAAEKHLFLRLDIGGVPAQHLFAIDDVTATLPSRPPTIPGRSPTGLWLVPEFARRLVWWTATSGWRQLELPDAASDPAI